MTATLSYADLEARWGVSRRQLRRWVAEGRLKCRRLSHRTVRFDEADVQRFWDSCAEEPPVPRVSPLRPLSSNPVEDAILRRRREREKKGVRS